jgi:hypothetical protein
LHPNPHLLACSRQATVELLRVFAMRWPLFLELSGVGIHRSNLLKLGVEKSTPEQVDVVGENP